MATNLLGLGQYTIVSHVVIGTRNKIRPKKRVLKSGNPIPYFEVAESEYHGGFTQFRGTFEKIIVLRRKTHSVGICKTR